MEKEEKKEEEKEEEILGFDMYRRTVTSTHYYDNSVCFLSSMQTLKCSW